MLDWHQAAEIASYEDVLRDDRGPTQLTRRTKSRSLVVPSILIALAVAAGCTHERSPSPRPARIPTAPEVEEAGQIEFAKAYRANLGHGADLYMPPRFTAGKAGYDLLVHFHGEGRWQQANIEHSKLNVIVVSVNLGVGTESYSNAFKSPDAFERLLADTQAELVKSGRIAESTRVRRIALSAWSAGFSSIARVLTDSVIERVDAILLADGFFTYFSDPKKRIVNAQGLEKFARYAEAAERGEKLFAITHTTIPTGPYPSVQECVAKLLEMIDQQKTPAVALGPRDMHQIYVVDKGSFHIRGFEGTQASDHVKQLHAMGETIYPWLKARWDKQDEEAPAPTSKPSATRAVPQPSPRAAP